MSRPLFVLLAVLAASAPPPRANAQKTEAAPKIGFGDIATNVRVAWDAPAHELYFKYQRYLLKLQREAETQVTWDKLTPEAQAKKLKETEAFLKNKLTAAMGSSPVSTEDKNLIKAVWGDKVEAAVAGVAAARGAGDPAKLKAAVAQAAALAGTVGGAKVDWNAVFDGKHRGPGMQLGPDESFEHNPDTLMTDFFAVPERADFVESLGSPETAKILATQRTFAAFLREKDVPSEAMPGMLAMYQVLSGPPTASNREMAHLLPTVVTFLNDGKSISYDAQAKKDHFGSATPGDYDRPEAVKLTPLVIGSDPVIVGKTLAHEFQHIYDMYTGRYYTLDSEMRGFKVAVLYYKTLKERSPEKYASLRNSDDDDTRRFMRDAESYTRDYDTSPVAFREAVASFYQNRDEGYFKGNMSLRETVDPRLESGAVVELATSRARLEVAKREVAGLEASQARLNREYLADPASRGLARELEKVTKDLATERGRRDNLDRTVTLTQIRLKRMESEVAWMDRNAAAKGRQPDAHDLFLAVDRGYLPK